MNPWDRRPGEHRLAYEGFIVFRDLGAKRTLADVAKKLGRPLGTVQHWCARGQWNFRVDQWDAEVQRERDNAVREQARAETLEKAKEHETLAHVAVRITSEMMLRLQEKVKKEPSYIPAPETVLRLADMTIKLHRVTLGLVAEGQASPAAVNVNVSASSTAVASNQEVRKMAYEVRDMFRAWADRLPPHIRQAVQRSLDEDFDAVINAEVDRAEQSARALLPPPPVDIRTLQGNGEQR